MLWTHVVWVAFPGSDANLPAESLEREGEGQPPQPRPGLSPGPAPRLGLCSSLPHWFNASTRNACDGGVAQPERGGARAEPARTRRRAGPAPVRGRGGVPGFLGYLRGRGWELVAVAARTRDSPCEVERAAAAARQEVKWYAEPTKPVQGWVREPARGLEVRRLGWWLSARAGVAARCPSGGSSPAWGSGRLPAASGSLELQLELGAGRAATSTNFISRRGVGGRARCCLVWTDDRCRGTPAPAGPGAPAARLSPTCPAPVRPVRSAFGTLCPGERLCRGSSETSAVGPGHPWRLGWG